MKSFLSPVSDRILAGILPLPADCEQAKRGLERWAALEHTAGETNPDQTSPEGRALHALLMGIFGNSPFLTQCCLAEPAWLRKILQGGPDACFAEIRAGLDLDAAPPGDRAAVMRKLRIARRRVALLVAIADLTQIWGLEQVTAALSDFAETALGLAVRHLLAEAVEAADLAPRDNANSEQDSGIIVLGMGKLGARELNYSSDIDLVLLFDPDRIGYIGRHSAQQFAARFARDLVRILDERTSDGYVFRTDLRLRPDPASTPPAIAVQAALTYYESTGQNWERAAFIKARPVAADKEAGRAFLAELRPFLWRKHLDFAAIQDVHSIKRQINAYRGGGRIAIHGHNVKLGRGGIREIEFFAQTQQLIWGGRLPELRISGTCEALRALVAADRIKPAVAEELIEAYVFLRNVEHRLQMVEDAQTHTLPADDEGLERIAIFSGYPNGKAFAAALLLHLSRVEKHYAALFEEAPSLSGPGNLVFTGAEDDPETLATLQRLGFAEPGAIAEAVRGWHHGRYRATRSQRAREILTELVPALLRIFGGTANPDTAFLHFDQLLAKLPSGVQFFSLLQANPPLLELLAEIMGSAPRLSEQLARQPILLDGVLSTDSFAPMNKADLAVEFAAHLARGRDYGDILDLARRWANDRKFQICVDLLRGGTTGDAAGFAFADIADTVIDGLLPSVATEFARSHGVVPGGQFAVIGLGKLGGREMTVTSDLDLILLYHAPETVETSDGSRPLAVATYYARLSQRLINAVTALTPEGRLYEVDMRLRPSGSSGPIASSLAAFSRYHDELAWTWEDMALTRARAIGGDGQLLGEVMAQTRKMLSQPREADELLRDVADMRRRIATEHKNPSFWDIKHRRGGLIDAEFIAQYLMLRHAATHADLIRANTSDAFERLAATGCLDRNAAQDLIHALRLWRQVQGLLKLVLEEEFDEDKTAAAVKSVLLRGTGAIDFARLKLDMTECAEIVLGYYDALVEQPANRLAPKPPATSPAKPQGKP